MKIYAFFKNRGTMQLLKEISGLIGLMAVIYTLLGHIDNTYATNDNLKATNQRVSLNEKDIDSLDTRSEKYGSILCGIAIDLKLPTARKECNDIIRK